MINLELLIKEATCAKGAGTARTRAQRNGAYPKNLPCSRKDIRTGEKGPLNSYMRRLTRDLKVRGVGCQDLGLSEFRASDVEPWTPSLDPTQDVAPAEIRNKEGLEIRASDHDYTLSRG